MDEDFDDMETGGEGEETTDQDTEDQEPPEAAEEATGEEGEEDKPEEGEEEQEKEGEEEAEEEKVPEKPLTKEIVADCLTLLCKTGNGLAHAYVRADIHDKELSDITILSTFIHIRYGDISMNQLRDISPLNNLTHLLTLKADRNLLSSPKLDPLPYLQQASFASNRLSTTEGVEHPLLETLNISFNEISEIKHLEPSKLGRLHTLELRSNKLTSTKGIRIPTLKNLFLAANTISKLEDLEYLTSLQILHLRDNQVSNLDGFSESMVSLQYINMRGNNMADKKQVPKLNCLPILRALILAESPVSDDDDYRIEVLISLRRIERLDKDEFTDEERQEAEEIYEQRRQEALTKEETEEEAVNSGDEQ